MADHNAEQESTALYRHFDAAGSLLYVGISLCVVTRLRQHRRDAHWFTEIARIDVEWHPSREAACDAEFAAIRSEKPRHNITHTRSQRRPLAEMMRMLEANGQRHMVDDNGCILAEYMKLTPEDVDALADRM